MRVLILLTAGLVSVSSGAQADVADTTINANVTGQCRQLVIAGVSKPCPPGSVSLVLHHRHTSVLVRLQDGQGVSFNLSPDPREWRPGPGDYRLPLMSVYASGDAGERSGDGRMPSSVGGSHDVKGECRILLSPDGAIWHRLECHARDAARARYELMVGGGGTMTFVQRGRPVDPPFTPAAPRR